MNIFFGAGGLGKKCLSIWKECGLTADYFADNNVELWGKKVEGVEVIPPVRLTAFSEDTNIFVTCSELKSVFCQLRDLGIRESQIKRCNTFNMMLDIIRESLPIQLPVKKPEGIEPAAYSVLFGLDNGLTLGGVEFWSLDTAKELRKLGWKTSFLLNRETQSAMKELEEEHMMKAAFPAGATEWEKAECLMIPMLRYHNIICNFTEYILVTACLVKKLFPTKYRIIAIIHNDEEIYYYQNYMAAEPYIDKCLVISSKIRVEMIKRGFPEQKLVYLPWKIPCRGAFAHCYSQGDEPLRIGYAGRVVLHQKRVDLLLAVAQKLKQKGLIFRLEIAGTGSYEEELGLKIQKEDLYNEVRCLGMQTDMETFWSVQDIMITCSEYEGHSISQCEAMAAGAVPVITDTSGARDDVEDGKNGFIVEIGAIDQMVERLCFLYTHREQLPVLGKCAYETILNRNRTFNFQKLWDSILLP